MKQLTQRVRTEPTRQENLNDTAGRVVARQRGQILHHCSPDVARNQKGAFLDLQAFIQSERSERPRKTHRVPEDEAAYGRLVRLIRRSSKRVHVSSSGTSQHIFRGASSPLSVNRPNRGILADRSLKRKVRCDVDRIGEIEQASWRAVVLH